MDQDVATEPPQLEPIATAMTLAITVSAIVPLAVFEARYALAVLAALHGNKSHAARALGIDRRSLYRLIERAKALGIAGGV